MAFFFSPFVKARSTTLPPIRVLPVAAPSASHLSSPAADVFLPLLYGHAGNLVLYRNRAAIPAPPNPKECILVALPVGLLCTFRWGMGAPGMWVGFIFGLALAAVFFHIRFHRLTKSKIINFK